MKENLWSTVSGTEVAPAATEAEKLAKFEARRDRALATIVLSVDTSLLYLLGDPEDPVIVWNYRNYRNNSKRKPGLTSYH